MPIRHPTHGLPQPPYAILNLKTIPMNSFVFIIAQTPTHLMTPMRELLFRRCLGSLQAQTSNDWLALVVGDQPVEGPNIVHLKTDKLLKGPKLEVALYYLEQQTYKPKYLIRFDDDDVIAPDILQRVSRLEFDCVADRYHAYYDLSTGKTCLSKNH